MRKTLRFAALIGASMIAQISSAQQAPNPDASVQMRPDEIAWNAIRDSQASEPFKLFIASFPGSPYLEAAKARLKTFEPNSTPSELSTINQTKAPLWPPVEFLIPVTSEEPLYELCNVKDRLCGLINQAGVPVTRQMFTSLQVVRPGDGLTRQIIAGLSTGKGIFSQTGEWLIPPKFSGLGPLMNERAVFQVDGKVGFLEPGGNIAIKPREAYAVGDFRTSATWFCRAEGDCIYLDRGGNKLGSAGFKMMSDFTEGWSAAYSGSEPVLVDRSGSIHMVNLPLVGFEFERPFSEGLANVTLLGKGAYIDTQLNTKLIVPYRITYNFSEGLAVVGDGDKLGAIDRSGKLLIKLQFSDLGSFKHGLASACIAGKHGVVDKKGKWILKPRFTSIGPFAGGLAQASADETNWDGGGGGDCQKSYVAGTYGAINTSGKWVIPAKFDSVEWKEGIFEAKRKNRRIYFDNKGILIATEE